MNQSLLITISNRYRGTCNSKRFFLHRLSFLSINIDYRLSVYRLTTPRNKVNLLENSPFLKIRRGQFLITSIDYINLEPGKNKLWTWTFRKSSKIL